MPVVGRGGGGIFVLTYLLFPLEPSILDFLVICACVYLKLPCSEFCPRSFWLTDRSPEEEKEEGIQRRPEGLALKSFVENWQMPTERLTGELLSGFVERCLNFGVPSVTRTQTPHVQIRGGVHSPKCPVDQFTSDTLDWKTFAMCLYGKGNDYQQVP